MLIFTEWSKTRFKYATYHLKMAGVKLESKPS